MTLWHEVKIVWSNLFIFSTDGSAYAWCNLKYNREVQPLVLKDLAHSTTVYHGRSQECSCYQLAHASSQESWASTNDGTICSRQGLCMLSVNLLCKPLRVIKLLGGKISSGGWTPRSLWVVDNLPIICSKKCMDKQRSA
jgi:hypothetical protein